MDTDHQDSLKVDPDHRGGLGKWQMVDIDVASLTVDRLLPNDTQVSWLCQTSEKVCCP